MSNAAAPERPVMPRHLTWPVYLVLGLVGLSLVVVALDRFRLGSAIMAGALVLAAVMRAVLPDRTVGSLAVRSRVKDVLALGVLAAGLALLTVVIPPPTCAQLEAGPGGGPPECSGSLR